MFYMDSTGEGIFFCSDALLYAACLARESYWNNPQWSPGCYCVLSSGVKMKYSFSCFYLLSIEKCF